MSLEAGAQLGDYRILSRIGAGACGEVYEGEHIITRRRDAIKILFEGRHHGAEEEQRFLREIRVQASLSHVNIAAVHNAFWTPHGLALVMELVRGEPLTAILSRGKLPLPQGIDYMLQMLAGLSYAHSQGVVHRDIKPDNLLITADGAVKLTDFGLARSRGSPRLTQPGAFAGSPCYMSPEQAEGTGAIDARSDTYSAGVVLYEIATGQLPFVGETAFSVMLAHCHSAPQPPIEIEPSIGAELNGLILKALEKDAGKRYQTAADFHAALERVIQPAVAPAAAVVGVKPLRRTRIAAAAGICAALAGGTIYSAARRAPARSAVIRDAHSQPGVIAQPVPIALPPVAAAPDPPPPDPPPAPSSVREAPRKKKIAAPPMREVRIIGLPPEEPPPVRRPMEVRAQAVEAPAMTAPEPPKPQEAKSDPPVELKAETEKPATPKRRNPVVRVFQKVFGNRRDNPQPAKPPED